jgi:bifunctional non-homologous end joining protein LigD
MLDGELVAFDEEGRPSFSRLQRRMHVEASRLRRHLVEEVPVVYVIFDLLHLDGRSTLSLPYEERRRLLEELSLQGPSWRTPAYHAGDGAAMVEASAAQGLEGVIAKRLDSVYEPGRRSGAWLKIKHRQRARLVVGGWMPGEGGRRGSIGSLLVGYYEPAQPDADSPRLRYAGRVGSGLTDSDLRHLSSLLEPLRRGGSPFEGRQPPRTAIFVEPRLVVEVEFAEWTRTRTLRAPTFRGLVEDADPQEVVLDPGEG